jgi:hypothetical protein
MYSLTNIPHHKARAEVDSRVEGESVRLVAYDRQAPEGFQDLTMDTMFIGDHMLSKPQALREMVGRALVHAVIRARDVGYRQAQADIRDALGITGRT